MLNRANKGWNSSRSLRAILGAQHECEPHTIVVLNSTTGPIIQEALCATKRLPDRVEWMLTSAGTTLPWILRMAHVESGRVVLMAGDRTYRPTLHRMICTWDGASPGIDFVCLEECVGIFALSHEMATALTAEVESYIVCPADLHAWMEQYEFVNALDNSARREVNKDSWQIMRYPEDRIAAERKLELWLVKSTDGIFARFNRKLSIPLSRQLLKFPITPNMITLFTLVVGLASGVFFALGGYWNCLFGAVLSLWAGILDGNDGEIARMKMLTSDFGCWLDSVCDYLYYLIVFACMPIGLMRSTGDPIFLDWGIAILVGAILTFTTTIFGRKRLTHGHPEQLLAVWQKEAEKRSAGLFVNIGRYTEFIVRRSFLPYLILFLALCGLTQVTIYMAAIGSNIAWMISLRSLVVFARKCTEADIETNLCTSRDEPIDQFVAESSTSVCPRRHL